MKVSNLYTYLDLPNSAELMIRAAHTPSLSDSTRRFWYTYLHIYEFPTNIWLIIPIINPITSISGVFTHIYHKKPPIHVGKYTILMDGMGMATFTQPVVFTLML